MKRLSNIQKTTTVRSAFTLLELLAVIVIISILMALILPTLSGVLQKANETAVLTEMTQFDQALATFNQEFGEFPPSNVTLYGTTAGWNSDPKSKSKIRSLWKDFNFATGGRLLSGTPQNTDASLATYHPWGTTSVTLTGDECLVFFLSGVAVPNAANIPPTLSGFAASGRAPFAVAGANRTGPFFEFKSDRLVDATPSDTSGADLAFSYTDGLSDSETPMFYSSAGNGSYSAGDAVYFQADGKTPWNKDSFQIIGPGEDGEFGNIMFTAGNRALWADGISLPSNRKQERDNLTNFSGGRLQR